MLIAESLSTEACAFNLLFHSNGFKAAMRNFVGSAAPPLLLTRVLVQGVKVREDFAHSMYRGTHVASKSQPHP
jgi:hypothetical protein